MPTRSHRTQADLKRDLDLWHDEEASLQIETIAAACALIAYADGVVRPAVGLVDERSRSELLAEFEHATARFEIDPSTGERAALTAIARLEGKTRFAQALVETCRLIGEADGHYIVEEQSALVKICRQLGVDPVATGAFAALARA